MTDYRIVPAKPTHVGPFARRMGAEKQRIEAIAQRPRQWIRAYLQQSSEAWVAELDGVPVAMWGVIGPALATEAFVWLTLNDVARARKVAVVSLARAFLAHLLETRSALIGTVAVNDERAIRFVRFLGFAVMTDQVFVDGSTPYFKTRMGR